MHGFRTIFVFHKSPFSYFGSLLRVRLVFVHPKKYTVILSNIHIYYSLSKVDLNTYVSLSYFICLVF